MNPRQLQILKFIRDYSKTNGFSPSMREVGFHIGIYSTSHIQWHLDQLERNGLLRRNKRVARSLVVTGKGLEEVKNHDQPSPA